MGFNVAADPAASGAPPPPLHEARQRINKTGTIRMSAATEVGSQTSDGSRPGRRLSTAERVPPLARVVDEHQLTPLELLEPAPPLDRLEVFAWVGGVVAADADAVWRPDHARRPKPARGNPVVNRVVARRLVNRHCGG